MNSKKIIKAKITTRDTLAHLIQFFYYTDELLSLTRDLAHEIFKTPKIYSLDVLRQKAKQIKVILQDL